jgi:hypothetical protein
MLSLAIGITYGNVSSKSMRLISYRAVFQLMFGGCNYCSSDLESVLFLLSLCSGVADLVAFHPSSIRYGDKNVVIIVIDPITDMRNALVVPTSAPPLAVTTPVHRQTQIIQIQLLQISFCGGLAPLQG